MRTNCVKISCFCNVRRVAEEKLRRQFVDLDGVLEIGRTKKNGKSCELHLKGKIGRFRARNAMEKVRSFFYPFQTLFWGSRLSS